LRHFPRDGQVPGNLAGAACQRSGADEDVAPEDAVDHAEDDDALPGERHPLLLLHQPVIEEDGAARRAQQVDEVLDVQVDLAHARLVREERQVEGRIVGEAERRQRPELRDDEGDEDPDVRRAGGPLRLGRHPFLSEAVEQELLGPRGRVVPAHVRAVDAKSGEDLTTGTLAQIIIEGRGAARLLPVPLLVQLIRMGDDALAEFLGQYVTWALQVYLQAKEGVQALAPLNPFLSTPFGGGAMSRLFGLGPSTRPEAPAAAPSTGGELAALRKELEELKASLKKKRR